MSRTSAHLHARCAAALVRCAVAGLVAGGVVAVATPAAGQPTKQAQDAYKLHMANGVKLFQDKNFPAAIAEFKAAYEAKPKANPLVNIALCHKGAFNYPKAIQYLEKALKEHPDTMDAADKKAAEEAIREMQGLLAYVTVRVTPTAAIVSVDGEDVGTTTPSVPVAVGPGKHHIGAHLDGFDAQETEVDVVAGSKGKAVAFTLIPNRAWVSVDYPKFTIAIDGKAVSKDRWSGMLTPGQHVVQVYEPGKPGYTVPIVALAGQSVAVRVGPRGSPVVSGSAPVSSGPTGPVGLAPPPKKEDPPGPTYRGFYVFAGPSLTWELGHRTVNDKNGVPLEFTTNSGFGAQVIGGYRVTNLAAFELLFEYDNVFTPASDNEELGYTQNNIRIGPGLRLMSSGKTFRFVGNIAGGFAYNALSYSLGGLADPNVKLPNQQTAAAFLLGEFGGELDLNGVLIDLVGQLGGQTTRDLSSGGSSPGYLGGLGLRFGYAFWKPHDPAPAVVEPAK